MSVGIRLLKPFACIFALALSLANSGAVLAHRLVVECHVLANGNVQVESWFDLSGEPPRGARVQVSRTDGLIVACGQLDAQGIFVCSPLQIRVAALGVLAANPQACFPSTMPWFACWIAAPTALKVAVTAGAGHRAEQVLPSALLDEAVARATRTANSRDSASSAEVSVAHSPSPRQEVLPVPIADRQPKTSLKDGLIGITFLLALAAFIMSYRNARHLRELQDRSGR